MSRIDKGHRFVANGKRAMTHSVAGLIYDTEDNNDLHHLYQDGPSI
jgi:hypothetical protein